MDVDFEGTLVTPPQSRQVPAGTPASLGTSCQLSTDPPPPAHHRPHPHPCPSPFDLFLPTATLPEAGVLDSAPTLHPRGFQMRAWGQAPPARQQPAQSFTQQRALSILCAGMWARPCPVGTFQCRGMTPNNTVQVAGGDTATNRMLGQGVGSGGVGQGAFLGRSGGGRL